MGLLDFLKHADINQRLEEYDNTPEAVLVDVRTPHEFSEGHIPCSENIPLQQIEDIYRIARRKDTPLFVYCYSGARSSEAACLLREIGYTRVKNIGGICAYLGKMEYGSGKPPCWRGEGCFIGAD